MLRTILIILRELMCVNKAHIKHRWVFKYIKICAWNVCRCYKIRL